MRVLNDANNSTLRSKFEEIHKVKPMLLSQKEKKKLKKKTLLKHKLNITYTDLNRRCLFEFISIEKQLHEHCHCTVTQIYKHDESF